MDYKDLTSVQRRTLTEDDVRSRQLERSAASGSYEADAKIINDRMRRGELDRERVAAAASLGDSAAAALGEFNDNVKEWKDVLSIFSIEELISITTNCIEQVLDEDSMIYQVFRKALLSIKKRDKSSLQQYLKADSAIQDVVSERGSDNERFVMWAIINTASAIVAEELRVTHRDIYYAISDTIKAGLSEQHVLTLIMNHLLI